MTNLKEACKNFAFASWMPDGKGGWMPVPEILTEDETLRFLRMDNIDIKHPRETLRYYRKKYGLKGVQIGKALRFTIGELRKLVKRLMDENPR